MALFEVENMSVSYMREGHLLYPVKDASFSLEAGCIYDLTGPSGAGKSTLLSACSLMIGRESGKMRLKGVSSSCYSPEQWRRRVCLVPQQAVMFPGTIRDNLLFPWRLSINDRTSTPNDETLRSMLRLALLDDVTLDTNASQLSGGQKARVALLRSLATNPSVLLLDEVEAALDDEAAAAVGEMIRSMVDDRTTCLRIRHRAQDGYAYGEFSLHDGNLSYEQNALTSLNAPSADHFRELRTGRYECLSELPKPCSLSTCQANRRSL